MSPKVDARKMMERAVAVMKQSVSEAREDKTTPLVGAVLVKTDGTIETASRGELRDGDHAEFTLLERKNRATRLDGSVLFATLEPCAPGARTHPKLGCAERIVLARIKEVWVGVEDPFPTVAGKGIRHLQDHGVTVKMFDRDLQEEILAANATFIAEATARAQEEDAAEPAEMSVLERIPLASTLEDLDQAALQRYRHHAGVSDPVGSPNFNRRLHGLGLLEAADGQSRPTGFGLVLFGSEPRVRMPQAGLLGTILHGDGREEMRDFDGPAVDVPAQALDWLRDKLANPIKRDQAQRREVNEELFVLVREGLINALIHRDYSIEGAKCHLVVDADKVIIKSPGRPVEPITVAQLAAFEAPMLSRNPVLHFVFSKMKLAEERGLGLRSMRRGASVAGLPRPTYTYEEPFLVLTLFRHAVAAVPEDMRSVLDTLTEAERTGWTWMVRQDTFTTANYEQALGLPNRTARNHLKKLTESGLLNRTGRGRSTSYQVVRS